MVNVFQGASTRPGPWYVIPRNEPHGFEPEQIIVRELYYSGRIKEWMYWDIDAPTTFRSGMNIERFSRRIRHAYVHNSRDWEEEHILDIPVYKPSYIILRLSKTKPAGFMNRAVEMDQQHPAYGGLRYVDVDGNIDHNWLPNCRLVYFAALFMPRTSTGDYRQAVQYNVDADVSFRQRTPIDPDIRYPGNGGQFDEIGG